VKFNLSKAEGLRLREKSMNVILNEAYAKNSILSNRDFS